MPATPERARRRLASAALAAALLGLAAIPAYLAVPPAWRPAAVRLACALLAAIACARAVRFARRSREPQPASPLDASPAPPPPPQLDAHFVALRDDLIIAARNRRYFDVVLWPRLAALAAGRLDRPAARRGIRGPSLREVEHVVAELERRP
jgi:hypothetical protein